MATSLVFDDYTEKIYNLQSEYNSIFHWNSDIYCLDLHVSLATRLGGLQESSF